MYHKLSLSEESSTDTFNPVIPRVVYGTALLGSAVGLDPFIISVIVSQARRPSVLDSELGRRTAGVHSSAFWRGPPQLHACYAHYFPPVFRFNPTRDELPVARGLQVYKGKLFPFGQRGG